MKKLRVVSFGEEVQGVRLKGDRRNPEPESFRVAIPGGDVDVVRTTDGEYWVHIRVNKRGDSGGQFDDREFGTIVDARLDIIERHASEVDCGEFADPNLYHVALRVAVEKSG